MHVQNLCRRYSVCVECAVRGESFALGRVRARSFRFGLGRGGQEGEGEKRWMASEHVIVPSVLISANNTWRYNTKAHYTPLVKWRFGRPSRKPLLYVGRAYQVALSHSYSHSLAPHLASYSYITCLLLRANELIGSLVFSLLESVYTLFRVISIDGYWVCVSFVFVYNTGQFCSLIYHTNILWCPIIMII